MTNNFKGICFVLLSAIFFGLMGPFSLIAKEDGLTQSSMLLYRFFFAFLILLLVATYKGQLKGVKLRQLLPAFALGAIAYFLQAYFYFSALDHIDIGLTSIILYVYPALVVLLLWAYKAKRPSLSLWIGIMTAFAGVVFCFIEESRAATSALGIYLALGAALVYSCYLVVSEDVLNKLSPIVTSTFVCLGAACSYLLKILLQESFTLPSSINGYLAVGAFTLLSTVLGILFIFEGIKLIGAARTSVLSSIEPITAILIGTIFFNEALTVIKILGFCLVMFSVVYIATRKQENLN